MYTMLTALPTGPNAWAFWLTMICNVAVPQLLWLRWFRQNGVVLWVIAILVNVGMWAERFMLIVLPLQRDYLPSAWQAYHPTFVDWGIFLGTLGFFGFLFTAFLRWFPIIPTTEVKELNHELSGQASRHVPEAG
jgi:molybdopterin-containing oxidoreductase family membrane subunit